VQAGRPAPEMIAERLARMRDDAGRPILPMAPGTALCLACPWVPWPWLDLPIDIQARQHSQQAATPPCTHLGSRQRGHRPASDRLCGATEPPAEPVAAALDNAVGPAYQFTSAVRQ
jgi:hypothetical protein